jgi:predicted protein tyrosine phosphatase
MAVGEKLCPTFVVDAAAMSAEALSHQLRLADPAMRKRQPRRVLFLCRHNRMRSPTAERIFCKRPDLDVRSAGTSPDALSRVNARMLDWADLIFIMDEQQRRSLQRRFKGHPALERLICLDIPDEFGFLQPELVELLHVRATPHLPSGP